MRGYILGDVRSRTSNKPDYVIFIMQGREWNQLQRVDVVIWPLGNPVCSNVLQFMPSVYGGSSAMSRSWSLFRAVHLALVSGVANRGVAKLISLHGNLMRESLAGTFAGSGS